MSKTILHLGKMTEAELAEWRGVTESGFHKHFLKYSKELEEYCVFVRCKEGRKYTGVEILEIFDEVEYVNKGSKDYEQMKEFLPTHLKQNPLITTGTWAAMCYLEKYPDANIQLSTASVYARKIFKEWYPREGFLNNLRILREENEKGYYERVVGLSINGKPRLLTEEEEQLKYNLYEKFVIDPQKDKETINESILNAEDNKKQKFNFKVAYFQFKHAFYERTGGWIISGRKYRDYIEWDNEEKFEF